MNRSVEETATHPRESLSKYFVFHIFPSNSPAIRIAFTNLSLHVSCIRPKRTNNEKYFFEHVALKKIILSKINFGRGTKREPKAQLDDIINFYGHYVHKNSIRSTHPNYLSPQSFFRLNIRSIIYNFEKLKTCQCIENQFPNFI